MLLEELTAPQSMDEIVADVIERCGFNEVDLDIATSGLCGMFALALYRTLQRRGMPAELALLCKTNAGSIIYNKDGVPWWRHAVVRVNGALFDVDGRVRLEDCIANYCWGWPGDGAGKLLPTTPVEFIKIMRACRDNSVDWRHQAKWRRQLKAA